MLGSLGSNHPASGLPTVIGQTGLADALELDWLVDHLLTVCVMDSRRLETWRMCLPPEVCSMVN